MVFEESGHGVTDKCRHATLERLHNAQIIVRMAQGDSYTFDLCKKTVQFIETLCKGDIVGRDKKNSKDQFFAITKFPTSPLYIVRRTLWTVCNGEVGNFVMVKNSSWVMSMSFKSHLMRSK